MYLGKIVELADMMNFNNPYILYKGSFISHTDSDPEYKKERIILKGDVPNRLIRRAAPFIPLPYG